MAHRQCDGCGANMGPYQPRTRVGDQMLCDGCKNGEGRGMVSARTAAADHDVLYHITDQHHFSLDPNHKPEDNALSIQDRSGRKGIYLTDSPDHWRANGYHRPYVAEVHVPHGLAQPDRWGHEQFLPAEHFDQAVVHRVMPFDEHQREKYYDGGGKGTIEEGLGTPASTPPGKDVRDFTPEEHTEHLKRLRDYVHDVQRWGWNEFNDRHEHVGSDETDDEGMPVRRDRDGNVMSGGRYASARGGKVSAIKVAKHEGSDAPYIVPNIAPWTRDGEGPLEWGSKAVCDCGYDGPHRETEAQAQVDADRHQADPERWLRRAPVGKVPITRNSSMQVTAHDSGDGMTVFHCPFCGSGQVLARSDRTIECQFCHTAFTVQVQPVYPNFPQTIDGQPMQVPGMPGQAGPPPGAGMPPGGDPGADPNAPTDQSALGPDGNVPPTDEADAEADGDDDGGETSGHDDTGNPFAKKTYRTLKGAVLSEDDFVRHIAIAVSPNPAKTALAVRAARSRPCTTCAGSGDATRDPSGQRTFPCPCCNGAGSHEPGEKCQSLDTWAVRSRGGRS